MPATGSSSLPKRQERMRQPADVLGRIAAVGELPVDHGRETALVDDEVAEPEVAVDQGGSSARARGVRAAASAGPPRPPASGWPIRSISASQSVAGGERRVPGRRRSDPRSARASIAWILRQSRAELCGQSLAAPAYSSFRSSRGGDRVPGDVVHQVALALAECLVLGRAEATTSGTGTPAAVGGREQAPLERRGARTRRRPAGRTAGPTAARPRRERGTSRATRLRGCVSAAARAPRPRRGQQRRDLRAAELSHPRCRRRPPRRRRPRPRGARGRGG